MHLYLTVSLVVGVTIESFGFVALCFTTLLKKIDRKGSLEENELSKVLSVMQCISPVTVHSNCIAFVLVGKAKIIIIIIIIIIIWPITALKNDKDSTRDNRKTMTRKQKWERKQLCWRFKRLISNISHDKTWTWLKKGSFMRETESFLIQHKTTP